MFDDLADPLGAPAGDALGTVLARARRRRAVHRSAAAFAAVVAVVAVGASANALRGSHSGTVHVANGASTVPGATPTTAPAPTTTTTAAPNGTTPETRPATGSGPWSDRTLTITPQSLGAVRVGMTQGEARTAAAFSFDAGGDGFVYPTTLPAGFPHDYVGMAGSYGKERVVCVGASLWSGSKPSSQTISTPEGLHLGDTVQRLQAIYGTRARYVPAPSSGMTTNAGYVVADPGGYLVFVVGRSLTNWLPPTDRTSGRVVEIAGAVTQNPMSMRPTFGPNSCTG
jgi:hypothetical protein